MVAQTAKWSPIKLENMTKYMEWRKCTQINLINMHPPTPLQVSLA